MANGNMETTTVKKGGEWKRSWKQERNSGKKGPLEENIVTGGNGSREKGMLTPEELQRRALAEKPHESRDIMLAAQLAGEGGGAKQVPWKPWEAPEKGEGTNPGGRKTRSPKEIARMQARALRGWDDY